MSQKSDKTPEKPAAPKAKADTPAEKHAKDLPVGQKKADKVKGGGLKYR